MGEGVLKARVGEKAFLSPSKRLRDTAYGDTIRNEGKKYYLQLQKKKKTRRNYNSAVIPLRGRTRI